MTLLILLVLFLLGAAFGSFLNVIILRTVSGEEWVKRRSHCERCEHNLAWYDLIPLFSYVILRGKCRYCQSKISIQHPIVEVMIGLLFLWWGFVGFAFFQLVSNSLVIVQPLYWLLIGFVFLGVFFADLYYGIIPDIFVWSGIVVSILYRGGLVLSLAMTPRDFVYSLYSAIGSWLIFNFLYLVTRGKGMGYGDVKFVLVIGLVLGWPRVAVGLFMSFVIGALVGMGLILIGKRKLGQTIPFGPFLVIGTFVALLWGDRLLQYVY